MGLLGLVQKLFDKMEEKGRPDALRAARRQFDDMSIAVPVLADVMYRAAIGEPTRGTDVD